MKRSILVALGTSVFYWLIFTGFDYLAELGRWDNVRHFSVYNFWRNLALVFAPWLLCGIASRWLVAEEPASRQRSSISSPPRSRFTHRSASHCRCTIMALVFTAR